MGIKSILKKPLVRKYQRIYEKQIQEAQISLVEYLEEYEEKAKDVFRATEYQEKVKEITDDIALITTRSGQILEHAKERFAYAFARNPQAVFAYCDEMCAGTPWFKPDWSPDTFLHSRNLGGLIAVRRSAVGDSLDNWKNGYLDILESQGAFGKREETKTPVIHLPEILFLSEDDKVAELSKSLCPMAVSKGEGIDISIIIPSKDHPELVRSCVESVYRTVSDLQLQVIVVDNGSCEKNRSILLSLAKELNFTYLYEPMPFHFAKMCNKGAEKAEGKQLLFLNDDIECITPGWLNCMSAIADREHVGAVGSKLLYPDGKRIQHAGITNLPIGPVHKLQFLSDEETYYGGFNRGIHNVLAVTGACLLVRNELYKACGGMSERLAVAFNDVELCFKLYELGYYNVVVQDFPLYHHESLSRGDDESAQKWQRLMQERAVLYELHPALEEYDPFYSIHLNKKGLDSRIMPEYLSGRQEKTQLMQLPEGEPEQTVLAGAREDACLFLRTEICHSLPEVELFGYGVVLGSDNALFEKEILLRSQDGSDRIYRIPVKPVYRADLAANMPDQKQVAMSGFWTWFEQKLLPKGTYQVGMLAKDKTSRLRLYCFSSRVIEIKEP